MRAKLAAAMKKLKPAFRASVVCDLLLLGGAACFIVGLALVYIPLAWLGAGSALVVLAFKFAQTVAREKEDSR